MIQELNTEDLIIYQCKQLFPDYTVLNTVSTSLSKYGVSLGVASHTPRRISTPARYMLLLLGHGSCSEEELASLLGMLPDDVQTYGNELLSSGLVNYRKYSTHRELEITSAGRTYIRDNESVKSRITSTLHLVFNPLTGDLEPLRILARSDTGVEFKLPAVSPIPSLVDISLDGVRRAAPDSGVVDVTSLNVNASGYDTDMCVALLADSEQCEANKLMLFRGAEYLPSETTILQEMMDSGERQSLRDLFSELDFSIELPGEFESLRDPMAQVVDLEKGLARIDQDIYYKRIRIQEVEEDSEREGLEAEIDRLSEGRTELAGRLNNEISAFFEAMSIRPQMLRTEQLRELLLKAFTDAEEEIVVVSGFMRDSAFEDGRLYESIKTAVGRGATVKFAWGLNTFKNTDNDIEARNEGHNIERIINARLGELDKSKFISIRRMTHEKILICDDKYAVAGSFNWLSNSGIRGNAAQREVGVYSEDSRYISGLKDFVADIWDRPRS